MTDGDFVEINCEGAAPQDEGRVQWYFNNRVCIEFYSISNIELKSLFEVENTYSS